jgi:predicted O-linked N-acetylglucosamine transferase (SPINDLY family)
MRRRLEAAFDNFLDLTHVSDDEIAAFVRRAEIDILINLNGYFGLDRTGVFARRPAPIQVNYLGFPGTMGANYMDYIIADRFTIPESAREHYAESVVYLPECYQPNDRKKPASIRAVTRTDCGLPEVGFVFCCFNNSYKLTPDFFDVWMRLLRDVMGSVLWLYEGNEAVKRNLCREAAARGVAPGRLVFAPPRPLGEHLARVTLADLFLDTLPLNAHTTASDALWCGVPVLTCPGETFAGRVAASLLQAIGLPELIAKTLVDYQALALKLAREPALLATMKAKLSRNRNTAPLFDTPRYARNLERAYRHMWTRARRGLPPHSFAVEGEPE